MKKTDMAVLVNLSEAYGVPLTTVLSIYEFVGDDWDGLEYHLQELLDVTGY